jgi:hypothetical protein
MKEFIGEKTAYSKKFYFASRVLTFNDHFVNFLGTIHSQTVRCMMERLKIQEIKEKYPDEWVLLIEPETDANTLLRIRSGIVALHSPKRSDVYAALQQYTERRAIYFTGEIGKNKVYAL